MSRNTVIFGSVIGALLGFTIGTIIELVSPDGFSCLPSHYPTQVAAVTNELTSMFGCLIIVGICTILMAGLGTLLGSLWAR